MDGQQSGNHVVGYGRPPIETRFQKGQSGNPQGRPRNSKKLIELLGEALSRRSGLADRDGALMTQAEAIFTGLVEQAAGTDLTAKRLLFDLMIKLQRTDICWPDERLPRIDFEKDEAASIKNR